MINKIRELITKARNDKKSLERAYLEYMRDAYVDIYLSSALDSIDKDNNRDWDSGFSDEEALLWAEDRGLDFEDYMGRVEENDGEPVEYFG